MDEEGNAVAVEAAEEFNVWKKNSPFLYDLVISVALEWPSLTVQCLPSHQLLLGTHTSENFPNFLMLASVRFPPLDGSDASTDPDFIPSVQISRSVPHEGEVNRARFMPSQTSVVATKTCGPDIRVFYLERDSRTGEDPSIRAPDLVLKGHENEGYGISWSPMKEGLLLSGSYDSKICLWDVNVAPADSGILLAHEVYEAHQASVEDVAWHTCKENLFGSVGDDRRLMIWDLRSSTAAKTPQFSIVAHEDEVNSLSFNPFNEWILATASADTTVNLFDLRKLERSLHTFSSHTEASLQVEWNPMFETILASSSEDKRLMIWDLSRIGDEQSEEDAEDGPPELLFVHGGHTDKISEFSWSPDEPWVVASVAEDNIAQVWKIAESIYKD